MSVSYLEGLRKYISQAGWEKRKWERGIKIVSI